MTFLTYATNEDNDIFVDGSNSIVLKSDENAVAQSSVQAVRAKRNEMPFASEDGIPYFETIFIGNPDIAQIDFYYIQEIQKVPNVVRVLSLTSEIKDNVYEYRAEIETVFGNTFIEGGV
jgi:hypothetical protein